MDAKDLPAWEREAALKGLEEISRWWGQRRPLLKGILELLGPPSARRLKLIEVGAGSGHTAAWIRQELAKRAYRAEVLATDREPVPHLKVRRLDALKGRLP
jgi:hypothetical protein